MILDMVCNVQVASTLTNLTNSGTISGTAGGDNGFGVQVDASTLTNLTNSGTISGNSNSAGLGATTVCCCQLHPYYFN